MLFHKFFPDVWMNSTYEIPFEEYYKKGYRGILFDIDNTLVPHGKPADERAILLFKRLKQIGYEVCIMSNNKEQRVSSFSKEVGVDAFIFKANKPSIKSYQLGMKKMGTNTKNTLFVGDQLFTDIYGANRAGIKSILVNPIHPKEEIQIVLKRHLEKLVLRGYPHKHKK